MAMVPESENYKKILKLLRSSRPTLLSTEEIEDEVIKKISKTLKPKYSISDVTDFLFGWVYIDWVRRSLITCSVLLIMVFVWQQGIILKRINNLSRETIIIDRETSSKRFEDIERMLTIYSKSGSKLNTRTMALSEVELEELLTSLRELQVKYKDLENLINNDPELKKYIEKKLEENNGSKIKL
jgi:hypothetical protein